MAKTMVPGLSTTDADVLETVPVPDLSLTSADAGDYTLAGLFLTSADAGDYALAGLLEKLLQ
jgi:hypothetical protein